MGVKSGLTKVDDGKLRDGDGLVVDFGRAPVKKNWMCQHCFMVSRLETHHSFVVLELGNIYKKASSKLK